jgi:Phosphatase 4 regulatory subunit 3
LKRLGATRLATFKLQVAATLPLSTQADAIRFVHQLCLMGKNVPIPTRLTLYRTLVERGVVYATEWALRAPCYGTGGDALMLNGPQTGASMSSDRSPLIVVVDRHVAGVRLPIVPQNDLLKARGPENEWRRGVISILPPDFLSPRRIRRSRINTSL